jgi:hypothetical protein
MAMAEISVGRLVVKATARPTRVVRVNYAWRTSSRTPGRALQWWLDALGSQNTRAALLQRCRGV